MERLGVGSRGRLIGMTAGQASSSDLRPFLLDIGIGHPPYKYRDRYPRQGNGFHKGIDRRDPFVVP